MAACPSRVVIAHEKDSGKFLSSSLPSTPCSTPAPNDENTMICSRPTSTPNTTDAMLSDSPATGVAAAAAATTTSADATAENPPSAAVSAPTATRSAFGVLASRPEAAPFGSSFGFCPHTPDVPPPPSARPFGPVTVPTNSNTNAFSTVEAATATAAAAAFVSPQQSLFGSAFGMGTGAGTGAAAGAAGVTTTTQHSGLGAYFKKSPNPVFSSTRSDSAMSFANTVPTPPAGAAEPSAFAEVFTSPKTVTGAAGAGAGAGAGATTPVRKRNRRQDGSTSGVPLAGDVAATRECAAPPADEMVTDKPKGHRAATEAPDVAARRRGGELMRQDKEDEEHAKASRSRARAASRRPPVAVMIAPGLQRVEVAGTRFEISDRYRIIKPVGHGSYGVVVSAEDTQTGRKVAIKKISNLFCDVDCATRILREIKVVARLRHDNVLGAMDLQPPRSLRHFNDVYIFTELMETDMHRVIYSRQALTEEHISYFIYQLICALKFMHSAKVIHRDIKPSNILLNADCKLKVCDFGFVRSDQERETMTEYVVTRWYRAPEIMLAAQRYTSAVDIWSLGCVFAELLGSRPIFPGEDYVDQLRLISGVLGTPSPDDLSFITSELAMSFMKRQPRKERVPFTTLFPSASASAIDLLEKMLCFHPEQRITAAEALEHPFLAAFRSAGEESDAPNTFSFNFRPEDRTSEGIRAHFLKEISRYHPEMLERLSAPATSSGVPGASPARRHWP